MLAVLPELEHLELPVGGLEMPLDGFATLKRFVVQGSVEPSRLGALRERWGERLVRCGLSPVGGAKIPNA